MRLTYLDRSIYRRKADADVLAALTDEFGPCYLIPEGGANTSGVRGCAELPAELDLDFDVICCASGTATTLAGIAAGLRGRHQRVLGFAVLKGGQFLDGEVARLQREAFGAATDNWSLDYDSHFGGYAKRTVVLDEFMADFKERHDIVLDWVYEAKMMYGLFARIAESAFAPGTTIVAVLS